MVLAGIAKLSDESYDMDCGPGPICFRCRQSIDLRGNENPLTRPAPVSFFSGTLLAANLITDDF